MNEKQDEIKLYKAEEFEPPTELPPLSISLSLNSLCFHSVYLSFVFIISLYSCVLQLRISMILTHCVIVVLSIILSLLCIL